MISIVSISLPCIIIYISLGCSCSTQASVAGNVFMCHTCRNFRTNARIPPYPCKHVEKRNNIWLSQICSNVLGSIWGHPWGFLIATQFVYSELLQNLFQAFFCVVAYVGSVPLWWLKLLTPVTFTCRSRWRKRNRKALMGQGTCVVITFLDSFTSHTSIHLYRWL